jgi:hypothetical protein
MVQIQEDLVKDTLERVNQQLPINELCAVPVALLKSPLAYLSGRLVTMAVEGTGSERVVLEIEQQIHATQIFEQIRSFDADKVMCDVMLTAGNYSVPAHRLILAANSEYFRVMFTGNWMEKEKGDVVLHNVTPTGLKAIVEFCYHGKISVNGDDIWEIVPAFHHCQVLNAYEILDKHLCDSLNEGNFLKMFEFADMFSLQLVLDRVVHFAIEKFIKCKLEGENPLCKLEPNLFVQVIKKWDFTSTGFGHFGAAKMVMKWSQCDYQKREAYIPELLSCMNLGTEVDVDEVKRLCLSDNDEPNDLQACLVTIIFDDPSYSLSGNLAIFHPATGTWKQLPSLLYSNLILKSCGVTVLNNVVYVFGGAGNDGVGAAVDTCCKYDASVDRWVVIESLMVARGWFPLVSLGNKLCAIGGVNNSDDDYLKSVEMYDLAKDSWSYGIKLPKPLCAHAATTHNGNIYVCGGIEEIEGAGLECLFVLEDGKKSWKKKAAMLAGRLDHQLAAHKDHLYAFGGYNEGDELHNHRINDPLVECYDIATNMWTRLDMFESPAYTFPYGACTMGDQFYILFEDDKLRIANLDPDIKTLQRVHEEGTNLPDGAYYLFFINFPNYVLKYSPAFDFHSNQE